MLPYGRTHKDEQAGLKLFALGYCCHHSELLSIDLQRMPEKVIIITGASTGFGSTAANLLAHAGHIVYAGVRKFETEAIAAAASFSKENHLQLRTVFLDITDTIEVNEAVARVIDECGRIDVVIHNAGHGAMGPAEAFTETQLMQYFDINVLGAHRLNRAALPYMRKASQGLLVWTSSSSVRGGTPPFMGPYFAAKSAMDSLAVSYAGELARWGIETSIVVPGAFPKGTNHFASMSKPADQSRAAEYMEGPYRHTMDQIVTQLGQLFPPHADASEVAKEIARVVDMPHGERPYRTHVDPSHDGSEVVSNVHDRIRSEMLRRIGLEDLLKPASDTTSG